MSDTMFLEERDTKNIDRISLFKKLFESFGMQFMKGSQLLSLSNKFKKIEKNYIAECKPDIVNIKVAVLASYTTHHFVNIMRLFFYKQSLAAEIYEGEYDSITNQVMDKKSSLRSFHPEALFLLTNHSDIKDYPPLFSSEAEVNNWLDVKVDYYKNLWEAASDIQNCQIYQTLFVTPLFRSLGNLEGNFLFTPSSCVKLLNLELIKHKPTHVTFIDMDHLASIFGKDKWFDEKNYFISKQPFSLDAAGCVSFAMARILASHYGKIRKCLTIDLDNTIWGGVIGDDGIEGINIDPNNAVGEAFLEFQSYLLKLKNRGIILAVCSKNDEDTAKQPFLRCADMRLALDDIACFVANWDDKASNLRTIARKLNIGLEAIVFFDDNPAERELVRRFAPEVEVVEVPEDPALYVRALDQSMAFEWNQVTKEDMVRSSSYIMDRERDQLKNKFVDYDSYLQSLEMTAQVGRVGAMELPRFVQLINKSNQFNLRTKRYSESDIETMRATRDKWELIYISVQDKFSNYGIISCIIMGKEAKEKRTAFIDTWVMSCRVLNRGIERLAYNFIVDAAKNWGCEWIAGEYLPTKKNKLVSGLFLDLGFEECPEHLSIKTEQEGDVYRVNLAKSPHLNHYIQYSEGE